MVIFLLIFFVFDLGEYDWFEKIHVTILLETVYRKYLNTAFHIQNIAVRSLQYKSSFHNQSFNSGNNTLL